MAQPPGADAAAADASTLDSSDEWFARMPNAVVVGATTIAWSEQEALCGLETGPGCHGPGPMITVADAQGQVTQLVTGMYGATSLVGDDTGWFYTDLQTGAVTRVVEGGSPMMLTGAQINYPVGPVLDPSYVYWFQPGANGVGRGLMRASRTGDGSDAALVAQPNSFQDSLYAFAGDLWWYVCSTSCNVYRASSPNPVRSGAMIVGADATALYLVEPGATWNLLSMTSNGTTTTLLANQPQSTIPRHVIADGGELFWASGGRVYRAVANGTPTHVVDTDAVSDNLIAVTPTQILYDFAPRGYAAVAR